MAIETLKAQTTARDDPRLYVDINTRELACWRAAWKYVSSVKTRTYVPWLRFVDLVVPETRAGTRLCFLSAYHSRSIHKRRRRSLHRGTLRL